MREPKNGNQKPLSKMNHVVVGDMGAVGTSSQLLMTTDNVAGASDAKDSGRKVVETDCLSHGNIPDMMSETVSDSSDIAPGAPGIRGNRQTLESDASIDPEDIVTLEAMLVDDTQIEAEYEERITQRINQKALLAEVLSAKEKPRRKNMIAVTLILLPVIAVIQELCLAPKKRRFARVSHFVNLRLGVKPF
ncbi:hypothetical protein IV203_013984 [Nitzschia inconspicua]|uniref:Uncharacterized protein n=1 Tax=Nitzschia inconspicua TaxID=303405 RepID=A0A9K3PB26_9STRA|nr:hypothetical protein IV203_014235 [Nitzschia inconspicua]KAG7374889.1 hypothetical protein IV203_013984 [Nitzschia inconspicua]